MNSEKWPGVERGESTRDPPPHWLFVPGVGMALGGDGRAGAEEEGALGVGRGADSRQEAGVARDGSRDDCLVINC
ncbi:hypothetical protein E2C01_038804 [Portunus trituberculatus]|uniref:Uncharacterized protein n=1 Tax=Portunus trituberculatus TaxID=210409 RepID=A0A5B7FIY7_PORTR|nr:hypothetical protein [Portunus trituberculatus]